jgi:hypothetical protein
MVALELLALPTELIVEILASLNLGAFRACENTCCTLRKLIRTDTQLQYRKELLYYGYKDNPFSPLTLTEKLNCLRRHELAWQAPTIEQPVRVHIPDADSLGSFYELKGNILFFSALSLYEGHHRTFVRYILLNDDIPRWKQIRLKGDMLDIAVCATEHDLLAFLVL